MIPTFVFQESQDAIVVFLDLTEPFHAIRVVGEDGMFGAVAGQVQGRSHVGKILEWIALRVGVLHHKDEGICNGEHVDEDAVD